MLMMVTTIQTITATILNSEDNVSTTLIQIKSFFAKLLTWHVSCILWEDSFENLQLGKNHTYCTQ